MKRIKLYGDLQRFKADWLLNVETPAEAMRAINANRPGFIQAADAGDYVLLMVDEKKLEAGDDGAVRQVVIESANWPWSDEVLCVVPRAGGEYGVGEAIVIAIAGAAFAATTAGIITIAVVNLAISIAISIAVSMIAKLISGTPDGQEASRTEVPENRPSYLMNGVVNTTRQGFRVPLLYGGPLLVGSVEISKQIHTQDVPT